MVDYNPSKYSRLSATACLQVLDTWLKRQVELSEAEFDDLMDTVIGKLDEAADQRFRLRIDDLPF